jgi:hypothetical protein
MAYFTSQITTIEIGVNLKWVDTHVESPLLSLKFNVYSICSARSLE